MRLMLENFFKFTYIGMMMMMFYLNRFNNCMKVKKLFSTYVYKIRTNSMYELSQVYANLLGQHILIFINMVDFFSILAYIGMYYLNNVCQIFRACHVRNNDIHNFFQLTINARPSGHMYVKTICMDFFSPQ